jgi:hypothetical protein
VAIVSHLYPSQNTQPRLVEIFGNVAIGGSGAVGTIKGKGFTVARTGTGLYTITVTAQGNKVPDILNAWVDVIFATGTATLTAKILTLAPSTGTVTIQTATAAAPNTAADPTSGAILQINLCVQNSSQTQ